MASPLDTLQIVKRLKEAGFAEPQAEALTIVFRDFRETDFSTFATRADIQSLKSEIERVETKLVTEIERVETKLVTEIGLAESKLEVKIAESKAEVIRWVFGIAFAQAALILTILRLFPGAHP
jgi:hypothetical protein